VAAPKSFPTPTTARVRHRADWQLGEERGVAEILSFEQIAWQIGH
jgi:hypothetical protein